MFSVTSGAAAPKSIGKGAIDYRRVGSSRLLVSKSRTPDTTADTADAIADGHSDVLNRLEGRLKISANRRAALGGQSVPNPGQSLDEYPFASSQRGGAGACVLAVPREEQAIQGGKLSQFYQTYNLKRGDPFRVEIVE
ncbi:NucA/NucB deoxyribonuclease domain-containing protein [Luteibacter sp. 621]|uniref:NucA/NucB deoxyribonuclease domain-containing protein n=1 Tax=Luteibacter sp. 621 TaxID=3373916 RepID=UPI003D22E3C2